MSPSAAPPSDVERLVIEHVNADPCRVLVTCDTLSGPPPARHIDVGIREMTAVSVSAGLAAAGMRPVLLGLNVYLLSCAFGQLQQDVVLNRLPVTVVGKAAGGVLREMGPTHLLASDLRLLRALRPLRVSCPITLPELAAALDDAARADVPSYVRVGALAETWDGADADGTRAGVTVLTCGRPDPADLPAHTDLAAMAGCPPDTPIRIEPIRQIVPLDIDQLQRIEGTVIVLERNAEGLAELVAPWLRAAEQIVLVGGEPDTADRGASTSKLRHCRPQPGSTT